MIDPPLYPIQVLKMSHSIRFATRRQGATVVEMAVVLPVFVLFLFAFFELGHALMVDCITENAAYEGARRGIVPGVTEELAEQAAEELATASGLRFVDVEVDTSEQSQHVRAVTVTVNAPLSENSIFMGSFLGNTIITRSVTMIHESDLRYRFTRDQGPAPDPIPRPRGRRSANQ